MSLRCSPLAVVVCAAITHWAVNRGAVQEPHALSESRFYTGPTFSPDGNLLAVVLRVEAGSDPALPEPEPGQRNVSKVELWDVATKKIVRTLGGQSTGGGPGVGLGLRPLTFSPDGKTLALAESHGRVRLWDTPTWQEGTLAVPGSVGARRPPGPLPIPSLAGAPTRRTAVSWPSVTHVRSPLRIASCASGTWRARGAGGARRRGLSVLCELPSRKPAGGRGLQRGPLPEEAQRAAGLEHGKLCASGSS